MGAPELVDAHGVPPEALHKAHQHEAAYDEVSLDAGVGKQETSGASRKRIFGLSPPGFGSRRLCSSLLLSAEVLEEDLRRSRTQRTLRQTVRPLPQHLQPPQHQYPIPRFILTDRLVIPVAR